MHDQIKDGMPVFALGDGIRGEEKGVKGDRIGSVDHLEGDGIKLARKDSPDGSHHWIPLDWVREVVDGEVHLSLGADVVKRSWKGDAPEATASP